MLVGAELQQITYREFLPVVLGSKALGNLANKKTTYDQNVDPSILNEFATVAFRCPFLMLLLAKLFSSSGLATRSLPTTFKAGFPGH